MKKLPRWLRWSLALLACVCFGLWCAGEVSQWVLRLRAERMLADFRAVELGQKSAAQAGAFFRKWSLKGDLQTYSRGDETYQMIRMKNRFPEILQGNCDGLCSWLVEVIGWTGLRASGVMAGVTSTRGMVTAKGFVEDVSLPAHAWYARGGAYVPDLNVDSVEVQEFEDEAQIYIKPLHPLIRVGRMKGPYGLIVNFALGETDTERRALMDFRFNCITQIIPCHTEGEILSEGERLLKETEQIH